MLRFLQCGVFMDIRSLELFQHLATSLHFAKTSDALFVSPSTLSRAIQRLEEECGTALFVRDNRENYCSWA